MIQVYKKNELFIIENTVTDIIYPNLTREETIVLLKKFDRKEPEHRCDFAIKEDNISFEYASLDDKDKTIAEQRKQIADLEAKLADMEKSFAKVNIEDTEKAYKLTQLEKQLAEKDNLLKMYPRLEDMYPQLPTIVINNQDKISFALEQLEKVRNNIKKVPITDYEPNEHFEKMYKSDAIRQIDNQIKQLKEMK